LISRRSSIFRLVHNRESTVAMDTSDSSTSSYVQEDAEQDQLSTGASSVSSRRLRLAHILSQMEEIKLWSDAQIQMLQAGFYSRIAELEVEIHALESRSPEDGDHDYVGALAGKLEELAARGDAVYDLLVSMLPVGGRSGSPSSDDKEIGEANGVTPEPEAGSPEHLVVEPQSS
jgi:hypothetical protein